MVADRNELQKESKESLISLDFDDDDDDDDDNGCQ